MKPLQLWCHYVINLHSYWFIVEKIWRGLEAFLRHSFPRALFREQTTNVLQTSALKSLAGTPSFTLQHSICKIPPSPKFLTLAYARTRQAWCYVGNVFLGLRRASELLQKVYLAMSEDKLATIPLWSATSQSWGGAVRKKKLFNHQLKLWQVTTQEFSGIRPSKSVVLAC